MPEEVALEGGAYEVIRARLDKHGEDLRDRLGRLDADRKEVFGAVQAELVATERVTTRHNCVPRDMVAIGGNRFLFGYNIQFGLKATTEVADVFGIFSYDPESHGFAEMGSDILTDPGFVRDFADLYRYYRETVFAKFLVIGPHLYMGMRVGKEIEDIKTFKWLIGDGNLEYLGNRSDHEYLFPEQQDFRWRRAHRDMHRSGEHPHISINDRVFIETVGGDLTVQDRGQHGLGPGDLRGGMSPRRTRVWTTPKSSTPRSGRA